ncbi:MAG: DUF4386 domain-containing protein [Bacteroidota bacterium]
MTTIANPDVPSKAARVAGFFFLLATATVIFSNYGINFRLIVPGNMVATAQHIHDHETLFRLNIACNIVYSATLLVLASSLYVLLKNVNQILALIAASCRILVAVTWCITVLNSLGALRLLVNTTYLSVFEISKLQTLASVNLASSYDAYYIGLPFWAIASTICSYLLYLSKYIPKPLALFGIISSAWCVFCAFAFLVYPHFTSTVNAGLFDIPMVVFEIVLGFWFLFKPLRRIEMVVTEQ